MRFGPWHPLADAAAAAPDAPGVLQARAEQVLVYPSGKSAMVLYACTNATGSLRALTRGPATDPLRQVGATGVRWIRFAPSDSPEQDHARLLARFVERFGAPPFLNHMVNHG